MNRTLSGRIVDAGVILLAVGALGFAAVSLWKRGRPVEAAAAQLGARAAAFDALVALGTPLRAGPATDTIVVFTDFQCPYCRIIAATLDSLGTHGDMTSPAVILIHSPIESIHPLARVMAIAAECAAGRGKLRELHDALFAAQNPLHPMDSTAFGVFLARYIPGEAAGCLLSPTTKARVDAHVAAGRELGIRGTPTLLIDGHWINGSPTLSDLRGFLRKHGAQRQMRTSSIGG